MFFTGKVAIAADHGGYVLKEKIKKYLADKKIEFTDFGTDSEESCDYPDFAAPVCKGIVNGEYACGILICGTGIGMSMAANKYKGIRASHCTDTFSAKYTRLHNDSNVLCLGGRITGEGIALEIVDIYLNTPFEGGRHAVRISKFE